MFCEILPLSCLIAKYGSVAPPLLCVGMGVPMCQPSAAVAAAVCVRACGYFFSCLAPDEIAPELVSTVGDVVVLACSRAKNEWSEERFQFPW